MYYEYIEQDFAIEVCEKIKNTPLSKFTLRNPAWRKLSHSSTIKEMEAIVGIRDAKELMKRKLLMLRKFPNATRLEFSQYSLPDNLADELIDSLPKFLKELGRDEMVPILQVSTGGTMLYPHKGHYRKASIFKLLKGDKETTTWWKNTEDFKVVNEYRIPDVRKLDVADQAELVEDKWLIFNHFEWHSVQKTNPNSLRINVGVDFNTLSAQDISNLFQKNSI
jgi:hypothetical protein